MTAAAKIEIMMIEDSDLFAATLGNYIDQQPDMRCVHRFSTLADARSGCHQFAPDLVLLDLNLPDGSGLELLPELKLTLPKVRILMLTVFDDERSISQAIDLGADGFLLKRSGLAETAAAIRKTYAGEAVLSGSVAVTVLQVFKRRMLSKPMLPKLTAQENRLLRSLTEGSSLKQASGDIGVTYSTGRSYLRSIFTKLKVSSQTQAVLAMLGVARH